MSQQNRGPMTPREKTIADHPMMKIKGPNNSEGKRPTLHFYLHINANDKSKNAPRCVVYTNSEQDKQMKVDQIQGEMDIQQFKSIMRAIEDAADKSKEFKQETIMLSNYTWMAGQRSNEPMPKAFVVVGRRENGVVFIALKHFDKNRPTLQFDFGFTEFAKLIGGDGQPDAAQESRRAAQSQAEIWREVVSGEHYKRVELPQPYKPNGGGGNFGGNGGGGSYGGGNRGGQGGGYGGNGGYNNNQQGNQGGGYSAEGDTLFGEPI